MGKDNERKDKKFCQLKSPVHSDVEYHKISLSKSQQRCKSFCYLHFFKGDCLIFISYKHKLC